MRFLCLLCVCGTVAWLCGSGCVFDSSGMRADNNESDCANGLDDDDDGRMDCADSDCASSPVCSSNSNNGNNNNSNLGPEYCTNGIDDNGDGRIDCADPLCSVAPACLGEDCGNGVDDDGDGAMDCADADCSGSPLCVPEECTNGVDDDGDGLMDCLDPECFGTSTCLPEVCRNGVDDDLDGLLDCDDDDCLGTVDCGDCHPITNAGCTAGRTCYLDVSVEWFGICFSGSGTGGSTAPCGDHTDCLPGYYCTGSDSRCRRVCRPGEGDCAAIGGTYCSPFSDFFGNSPWGICVI